MDDNEINSIHRSVLLNSSELKQALQNQNSLIDDIDKLKHTLKAQNEEME